MSPLTYMHRPSTRVHIENAPHLRLQHAPLRTDDTWSTMYLLSRSVPTDPDRIFNFALIQCSTYNTTNRARIASKILFDLKRFDVAVAVGLYTGEDPMKQLPVVGAWELSDFVAAGGTVYYGTDHLAGLMRAATPTDPLFVVEIAPATSLGGAIMQDASLSANTIVVAMSGSVYHGYGNSSHPQPEYNVVQNVSASEAMYAAKWLSPLMTAPLDTSGLLHCSAPEFTDLIAANATSSYAHVLLKNYQVWCGCTPNAGSTSDTLYDAQAAYQTSFYARAWVAGGSVPPPIAYLTQEALHMSVNSSGFTVIDAAGQPVWPAVSFPDGLSIDEHLICADIITNLVAAGVSR